MRRATAASRLWSRQEFVLNSIEIAHLFDALFIFPDRIESGVTELFSEHLLALIQPARFLSNPATDEVAFRLPLRFTI